MFLEMSISNISETKNYSKQINTYIPMFSQATNGNLQLYNDIYLKFYKNHQLKQLVKYTRLSS